MSRQRRAAEASRPRPAPDAHRVVAVAEVLAGMGEDGGDLVVLDWHGDGLTRIHAGRLQRADGYIPAAGHDVLVALTGRTPIVLGRVVALPPA